MIIISTASCYTQRKASEQVDKAYSRYESVVAGKCGNWYPIKIDTVHGEPIITRHTDTIPGETIIVNCDSLNKLAAAGNTSINTVYVPVKCPPSTHSTDSIKVPIYIVKENTAKLREAELKIKEVEATGRTKNGLIGVVCSILAVSLVINYLLFKQIKNDRKNV